MRTEEVLQLMDRERAAFDAAHSILSRERLVAPGAAGVWSAKDIVAHVTWAEREMIGVLQRRELAGSDLWRLSQDERNAAVYAEDGQFVARVDFLWREARVVVEYEGDQHRTDRRQWQSDIQRTRLLEALGWRVMRMTAADLFGMGSVHFIAELRALVA